jgi:uncharacterized UPF0160 family protein
MQVVAVHSGSFHADDVFAVATVQLLLGVEDVQVLRTRDEGRLQAADWVLDVGGVYDHAARRYDHHQLGAPVRPNGIPYAAFGLVWRHWGEQVAGSKAVAEKVEEKLCLQVDAGDNGVAISTPNEQQINQITFDAFTKTWRPIDGSNEDMDAQFLRVVEIAREYLWRVIEIQRNKLLLDDQAAAVYEAASNKKILVSENGLPRNFFIDLDTEVVVFPDDDPAKVAWLAIAVPISKDTFATKVKFPKIWAGLLDEELSEASGIAGGVFCHKDCYMCIFETKEAAVEAAKRAN